MLLDDLFIFLDHFLERLGIEVGIEPGLFLLLLGVEHFVESMLRDFEHDAAEHLDQAAVGIGGEAWIAAAFRQGLDALIVETEIENGVHHAGHGKLRARAHAHQQRVLALAQFLALQFLQLLERGIHLAFDFGGNTVGAHVFPASLGLDGEAGRHGQPGVGHLGETCAFAAEVILHLAVAVGLAAAERVNILRRGILVRGLNAGFGESLRRHN